MTDCPNVEVRDQLPDYLHGGLTADSRDAIASHLATCADCRAELELLRVARASLRRAPAIDVGRIVASLPAPRRRARTSWSGWRAAAAIACIAIGGTTVAVATARRSATKTGARELVVASGTIAELNDRELSALVNDIESIDVVPSTDVEPAGLVASTTPPAEGVQ